MHRDLKPSNILIEHGGRALVSDLGLAQLVTRSDTLRSAIVTGTPAYMAPEIARGEPNDQALAHRIDVYGLGLIAYELLTGQRPFRAAALQALLVQQGYEPPPKPSTLAPHLPAAFDAPLMEALAKDPRKRTADVESFRVALHEALQRSRSTPHHIDLLVVDDDPGNRRAMQDFLEDAFPGATIRCANDGSVAADLARERTPSIVITDLVMPTRGALELTAALRSSQATAHVPIVVVTGLGGAQDWKVLHALGADRFLVKPIEPNTLLDTLRSLLVRCAPDDAGAPSQGELNAMR